MLNRIRKFFTFPPSTFLLFFFVCLLFFFFNFQASGEAVFVNDLPKFQHELFGALTLADVASGIIAAIDGSEVLVS